jgi:microcystin-dependent protein
MREFCSIAVDFVNCGFCPIKNMDLIDRRRKTQEHHLAATRTLFEGQGLYLPVPLFANPATSLNATWRGNSCMSSEPYLGSIFMFAGNFAPRGFQLCQGQILSISSNTALFSILGTTFGGNGQTTFALPDLRGRVPMGAGQGPGLSNIELGEVDGNQNVNLTINTMPMHTHTAVVTLNAANDSRPSSDSPSGAVLDSTGGTNIYAAAPDGTKMNAGAATAQIGVTGGSEPFSILNPYLGINFIIAVEGIFPSRN